MSTEFVSRKPILMEHLKCFDFKGIHVDSMPDENAVILTDGTNYFRAIATQNILAGRLDENGTLKVESGFMPGILFTRHGGNRPEEIIRAIEEYFDTELISEYEDDFEKYVRDENNGNWTKHSTK